MQHTVVDSRHAGKATLGARFGKKAMCGGFTFQPVEVFLVNKAVAQEFLLHDFAKSAPAVLRLAFEEQYDAAWVRARLPRVFGFTPEFVEEAESALLDAGMIALPDDGGEGIVFVCADHHGRAGLRFPVEAGPPLGVLMERVACAFWTLLLAEPDDLADFEQVVYHQPSDVWLKLGCLHGKLFCEESED